MFFALSFIGWWPDGERSMMARRVCPRAAPPKAIVPRSSGPRCERVSKAPVSEASEAFLPNMLIIPHMCGFSIYDSWDEKKVTGSGYTGVHGRNTLFWRFL